MSDTAVFITPMLDMSFQLLFFFVVMFQPQGEERRMPISAAAADAGGDQPLANPNPQAGTNITKTKTAYSLDVHAGKSGRVNRVVVNVSGNKDDFLIRPPAAPGQPHVLEVQLHGQAEATLLRPEGSTEEDAIRLLTAQLNRRMRQHKAENPNEDRIEVKGAVELKWKDAVAVMTAVMHYRDESGDSLPLYPKVDTNLLPRR